jgi:hypothetical protein
MYTLGKYCQDVLNDRLGKLIFKILTKQEYDSLEIKKENFIYIVYDENNISLYKGETQIT